VRTTMLRNLTTRIGYRLTCAVIWIFKRNQNLSN